jgi:hypothetical protein
MVEERIRSRATWEEVAAAHNVPLRTAERWRTTDEWRQAEARWRRILREETRTQIVEVAGQAVEILVELMRNPQTPAFTRFNCDKTLLEMVGIDEEIEEIQVDKNDEFMAFLKERQRTPSLVATLMDLEPLDGGLLPPQLQALTATWQEDSA